MIHLTYTGMDAGTYYCLRYATRLGSGRSTPPRAEGDEGCHAEYAPKAILDSPDLCPDCDHVFRCDVPDCPRCLALGYEPDTTVAAPLAVPVPMPPATAEAIARVIRTHLTP